MIGASETGSLPSAVPASGLSNVILRLAGEGQ
jgi:hypothetical protein